MADLPLIIKYRPANFAEIAGHETLVAALIRHLATPSRSHSYLLTGPAGIGKTTIARIIASEVDAELNEFDAATNSSVDAVRDLTELGLYQSLSGRTGKMLLIDECHRLSANAWDALLKILEEPPAHLYFALATTEAHRIKETISSRCYHIKLQPLTSREIEDFVIETAEIEGWTVNSDIFGLIVRGATGQPRKALALLQACHDAPNVAEAERIIRIHTPSDTLATGLRELINGGKNWTVIRSALLAIDNDDFESASIYAGRSIMNALLEQDNPEKAKRTWQLLDALTFPTNTFDRKAAFVAAIGRMLWA